ncbi:hypothetical protein [Streptomyces sp. NPDC006645]
MPPLPRDPTAHLPADASTEILTDIPTDSGGYRAARRPLTDHGREVT